ncbi:MAG: hypothetical protein EOM54_14475 [Clostridia bacterium]|nr:hypothetical protein [Clostridia bacterium]
MEKRGYARLVPRKPPEGLWQHALSNGRHSDYEGDLDVYGLIYEKVWVPDETPAGMFGDRQGKKLPMVLCRCSCCGEEILMDYVGNRNCSDGATYGFWQRDRCNLEVIDSGSATLCPICGCPVVAKCRSRISGDWYGRGAFITAETGCMSAMLLPGKPGERPLALIGWTMRRYASKGGVDIHVMLPAEAYVFDREGCTKLMGWGNSYSGNAGYFITYYREWHEHLKNWRESWGSSPPIFGLTEELLDQSCMQNAAFLEYMHGGLMGTEKFPIVYLRLYQKHPNVENLVRQGACHILDVLLREQLPNRIWENNKEGIAVLQDICWDQDRPSKMLYLDKDEFAMLMRRMAGVELWQLFVRCKAVGDRMTETDIETAFRLGDDNFIDLAGQAPMGKICRYLMRQIELACQSTNELIACGNEWDEDLEDYADPTWDATLVDATMLSDYWRMADVAGWDLNLPNVRWPKDLIAAHDRAMDAEKTAISKKSGPLFRKQFKKLSVFSFSADGILIRPCRSQTELTREGEKLDHCVAGYATDVAKGEKSIFFIRRTKKPGTPWFTLQFNPQKLTVVQNHGYGNRAPTKEVKAFVDLWLIWVRDGCKRDKNGRPVLPEAGKDRKTA